MFCVWDFSQQNLPGVTSLLTIREHTKEKTKVFFFNRVLSKKNEESKREREVRVVWHIWQLLWSSLAFSKRHQSGAWSNRRNQSSEILVRKWLLSPEQKCSDKLKHFADNYYLRKKDSCVWKNSCPLIFEAHCALLYIAKPIRQPIMLQEGKGNRCRSLTQFLECHQKLLGSRAHWIFEQASCLWVGGFKTLATQS